MTTSSPITRPEIKKLFVDFLGLGTPSRVHLIELETQPDNHRYWVGRLSYGVANFDVVYVGGEVSATTHPDSLFAKKEQ